MLALFPAAVGGATGRRNQMGASRRRFTRVPLAAVLLLTLALPACGGGGSTHNSGTPAGT
ncbi:MAG: hypothetical protein ABSF71_03150 [Terriglobia bacterium]|jgi:hypothetical protein